MKRVVLIAAVAVLSGVGLLTAEFAVAADAPGASGPTDNVVGGKPMQGSAIKSLKGRVWSQWADNPDGELLFGIQYWNTGDPASGTPSGRTSSDTKVASSMSFLPATFAPTLAYLVINIDPIAI
ncbi:MAG: hypothetical protein KGO23_15200, partial [Nitrospirota bacterium]|nr:hypothetical protein [Nitrospirota bacterium]